VQQAREILQANAHQFAKHLLTASKVSAKKGFHGPAEFALSHLSATDESGKEIRPLASGIDKQVEQKGSGAPIINIGFLTAPNAPKALLPEAQVIDVLSGDVGSSE
jgi:hypothetical protein